MPDELFKLIADTDRARDDAQRLFREIESLLQSKLPASADIRHIGATAVAGCLTKGDLDIVVRVPRADFNLADKCLAAMLARNDGSVRTDTFSAFENASSSPHLGIQLTAIGAPNDFFHLFVEALRKSPQLVADYNALKVGFDGRTMDEYRKAKDGFIEGVLAGLDRR